MALEQARFARRLFFLLPFSKGGPGRPVTRVRNPRFVLLWNQQVAGGFLESRRRLWACDSVRHGGVMNVRTMAA